MNEATALVYGEIDGSGLIFIPRDAARELSGMRRALSEATTWGDLKATLSRRRFDELLVMTHEEGEADPEDAEPFDVDELGPYGDGDWPEWPAQEMLRWMPAEVRDRFGKIETSVVNGDALAIAPSSEAAIIAAFETLGYSCVRDDEIVLSASGY